MGQAPGCREVAPDYVALITDVEYSSAGLLATWQESAAVAVDGTVIDPGRVFIVPVDPYDGTFRMDEAIIFEGAMPSSPAITGNGPEWALSQRGPEAYYNAYTSDLEGVELRIVSRASGEWTLGTVPESIGMMTPFLSVEEEDVAPFIAYQYADGFDRLPYSGWRQDIDPPEDVDLDEAIKRGRWVAGTQSLTVVDLPMQTRLGIYDTSTREVTWIYKAPSRIMEVYSWSAPEIQGRPAIIVQLEQTATMLIQGPSGRWRELLTLSSPVPDYPVLHSVEAFAFDRSSYAFGLARTADLRASILFVEGLTNDYLQLIEEPDPTVARPADPEYISTADQVFIYYTRLSLTEPFRTFVCDTSL
jgi:hypothetical protein